MNGPDATSKWFTWRILWYVNVTTIILKRSWRSSAGVRLRVPPVQEGEGRAWSRARRGPQAGGACEPPELPLGPPSPAPGRRAEAPSPPQRTCPIQRNCSPRTSPSGTPMTSWTKLRALSQRTRRVTGWGRGQCWGLPSPPPQLPLSAGHRGGRGGDTVGRSLRRVGLGLPTALCSWRSPPPCYRRSVPPECPRVQGGPAERHRGGCPGGVGPGAVQPGGPGAGRGRGTEQRTSPKGATKAELRTHSLTSALAWAPWERGLGPPL